jgi:hypothetical protein
MKARTWLSPAALMVARAAVLAAMVWAKIRVQAEVVEAVADQLAGAFAGVAAAPVSPHQPVAEVRFLGDFGLIRPVRGLQDPPADELAGGEASPKAEAGYLACGRDPPLMCMLDLGA